MRDRRLEDIVEMPSRTEGTRMVRMPKASANMTAAGKVMSYVSTAQALYGLGRQLKNWYDGRRSFNIVIPSNDMVFLPVNSWLLTLMQEERVKHLEVDTHYNADDEPEAKFVFSGDSTETVFYDGHKIIFSRSEPEKPIDSGYKTVLQNLYLTVYSADAYELLKLKIQELAEKIYESSHPARVHMFGKYGWSRQEQPLRPLESVVLPEGMAELVKDDLELFLASEKDYNDRGIPWHRGLMFDGPPGSGKTSLAKGLAREFNLDLYFLPVSDLDNDTELMKRVQEIPSRSILLMEDVDTVKSLTDREATGVTMSGMLNALDGVATPHGLVTILTTNNKDKIDDAILRPGRVDVHLHISYPDKEQTTRLFSTFYGTEPSEILDPKGRSTADLTEIFKQNFRDADAAEKAIRELE